MRIYKISLYFPAEEKADPFPFDIKRAMYSCRATSEILIQSARVREMFSSIPCDSVPVESAFDPVAPCRLIGDNKRGLVHLLKIK